MFHHPLAGKHKVLACQNWVHWQIISRLKTNPIEVPFIGSTKLSVSRGMHGATGNIYCGLHEFEDMAFVLHFLRSSDLFIDVGANVGTYTILASGVCGARTIAVEPVTVSATALQANIDLNCLGDLVQLELKALGEQEREISVSNALDCTNHVISSCETVEFERVAMTTLDDMIGGLCPSLIKIDVEGYEMPVLKGAKDVLANPGLLAIILEMNGSGQKYGVSDDELLGALQEHQFGPYFYDPESRSLHPYSNQIPANGNILFLRNVDLVKSRVAVAPSFNVMGQSI